MSEHPAVFNKALASQDDLIQLAVILFSVIEDFINPNSTKEQSLVSRDCLRELIRKLHYGEE